MGAEETATKTKCFNIPFSHAMCVCIYLYRHTYVPRCIVYYTHMIFPFHLHRLVVVKHFDIRNPVSIRYSYEEPVKVSPCYQEILET